MKLIEAMKKIKDLQRKAEDLRGKVKLNAAHLSYEAPTYGDKQREIVKGWIQALMDISKEIIRLRVAIQRTNLATMVSIELGGKHVSKSIAEWIHRRRDLAKLDESSWQCLNDKNLKEGRGQNSMGETVDIKIVRYYDPVERDAQLELYRSEPAIIDATLEVTNAVTDLIEQ